MEAPLEKRVLDEFIANIKSRYKLKTIENYVNQIQYDKIYGEWASFALLNKNVEYVLKNGDLSEDDRKHFQRLIS